MMGVSFTLPSMWDSMIFPFYFKAKIKSIIKLVINQQVASSCEWLGEDHLEKGGTKLAPHSLSHIRPTHSTHAHAPQATWHPPLGTKAAKVGCHVVLVLGSHAQQAQQACGLLLLLASTPSMLVRAAAAGLVPRPALLGSKQWPSHAAASCCGLARLAC